MSSKKPIGAVVVFSGGMDSYTLLHRCINIYGAHDLLAVSVDYGQRHGKELEYARRVCKELQVEHVVVDLFQLSEVLDSSLTTVGAQVPEGHYEEESMKATVVPNRNMIMLSVCMGIAVSRGCRFVYYGAHAGDHAIYPDCRPEFLDAMNMVGAVANYAPVEITAPFMDWSKIDIASYGKSMDLNYGEAWTCYNGRTLACGKCGSCVERKEAILESGAMDTMRYEDETN